MLLVVLPLAFIASALCILIYAFSVGFAVAPGTSIGVFVNVSELSLSSCRVECPLTFVPRAIRPLHRSLTVPHAALPVTSIDSSGLVSEGPVLGRKIFVVGSAKSFFTLIDFEILSFLERRYLNSILSSLQESSYPSLNSCDHCNLILRPDFPSCACL